MALEEKTILDKYEIVSPFKQIQCRHDRQIVDSDTGEVRSKGNYVRHVLNPGDDTSSEDPEIQAVAAAIWTPEVIAAYAAHTTE